MVRSGWKYFVNDKKICDKCCKCKYHIQNTDEGWDCVGQEKPCCNFVELKEKNNG